MVVDASGPDLNDLFIEFAEAARHFVALLSESRKGTGSQESVQLLGRVEVSLAQLYTLALRLPDVDPETDTNDEPSLTPGPSVADIAETIGPIDEYWTVYDPTEEADAVVSSLADDLYDVGRDLLKSLLIAERGGAISESVFMWRSLFNYHWGMHAVNALRVIHWHLHH